MALGRRHINIEELKCAITSGPVLKYYDVSAFVKISEDACSVGHNYSIISATWNAVYVTWGLKKIKQTLWNTVIFAMDTGMNKQNNHSYSVKCLNDHGEKWPLIYSTWMEILTLYILIVSPSSLKCWFYRIQVLQLLNVFDKTLPYTESLLWRTH